MNKIKKISISIGSCIILQITLTFINTLLNYIKLYNNKTYTIIEFIILLISYLIAGYIIGKKTNKKAWLEGLKLSILFIIILLTFNLTQGIIFNIKTIIYYLIIVITTIIGSIIGIQKKTKSY